MNSLILYFYYSKVSKEEGESLANYFQESSKSLSPQIYSQNNIKFENVYHRGYVRYNFEFFFFLEIWSYVFNFSKFFFSFMRFSFIFYV